VILICILTLDSGFSQPLHQSGNQKPACPNDDDSLRTTAAAARDFTNTFSCPGTCALGNGRCAPANQSIIDVHQPECVVSCNLAKLSTRKNEEDRCSVMDFSEFSVVHELPVW